jgi:uncharacterized protein
VLTRTLLLTSLLLLGPSCRATTASVPPATLTPGARAAPGVKSAPLDGRIVAHQGSSLIGEEVFHDDGDELSSLVKLGPKRNRIRLSRSRRTVSCNDGAEVSLDPETLALENGSWQSYALAAERFAGATRPRHVKVLLPCSGITVAGTVSVVPVGSSRRLQVTAGKLAVEAWVDERGVVVDAAVPAQNLRVRRDPNTGPGAEARSAPPSKVTDSELSVERAGVRLTGTLSLPQELRGKTPVALIIGGSGPVDRDGNSLPALHCDAYRMLGEELARRGVATVRYDKRGVSASGGSFATAPKVLDDLVSDAVAWTQLLQRDPRFAKLSLIGHSEGGLVATLAAQQIHVDALVLVATPGRKLDQVLRDQIAGRSPPTLLAEYDRIVRGVRERRPVDPVPQELAALFHPQNREFLASAFAVDPVAELQKLSQIRIGIVQGGADLQVGEKDAQALSSARADAKSQVLPTMNHVLKQEPARALPQPSYTDPARPLADGLVDAIDASVAKP